MFGNSRQWTTKKRTEFPTERCKRLFLMFDSVKIVEEFCFNYDFRQGYVQH